MNLQRFPYIRTLLVSFGYFTNNLTWSAYNVFVPFFLSQNFKAILGEDSAIINTLVAIVMILDNIASIIIQPYIGQLSDRTWIPKLGRRMPFVIIGLPFAAFFFGLIGSFHSVMWILLVAICGFNICMAFYKSPVMSLIPDMLPQDYRSQGSGVLNVVGGVASITGLVLVSTLIKRNSPLSFWASSIIMLGCLVILLLSVREKKDIEIEKSEEKINFFKAIKNTFKESDRTLLLMLFSIFFHTAGYTVAETYISRYATEVLLFDESTAGYILAAFVAFSVILALPAGLIGRKIGALNACLVGLIGFIIALIPITIISLSSIDVLRNLLTLNTYTPPYFEWTTPVYLFLVCLLGFSWLVLSINAIVVIWNMAPKRKTATYTSYFYVFLHLAAIISPFLAGGIFDAFGVFFKNHGLTDRSGLELMFVYIAICMVVSLALVIFVKSLRTKKLREIKDTDEYILRRLDEKEYPLLFLPMLLFGFGLREEVALMELRRQRLREKRRIKQEIRSLKRELRQLKKQVIIGDITEDLRKQLETIRNLRLTDKELKKEYQEKRQELLDEILKKKMIEHVEKQAEKESEKEKTNS